VNKTCSLKTNVDKRRFHTGHNTQHFTLIYIAYMAARTMPLEHQFLKDTLFYERNASFSRHNINQ
jgi:hypothetical protein